MLAVSYACGTAPWAVCVMILHILVGSWKENARNTQRHCGAGAEVHCAEVSSTQRTSVGCIWERV